MERQWESSEYWEPRMVSTLWGWLHWTGPGGEIGTWGYLCLLLDVSLHQDDTKRIRWSGLTLPCPCAQSQLEGQVTTLSQEVTRLQGQCKQESSQAKVWQLLPVGRRHSPP